MLPLLFKHYLSPITLEDIPAIREDDSSAASLGAFRAFSAKRDATYAKIHSGAKRRRNLGLELAMYFAPELGWQVVRSFLILFFCSFQSAVIAHSQNSSGRQSSSSSSISLQTVFDYYCNTSNNERLTPSRHT